MTLNVNQQNKNTFWEIKIFLTLSVYTLTNLFYLKGRST